MINTVAQEFWVATCIYRGLFCKELRKCEPERESVN